MNRKQMQVVCVMWTAAALVLTVGCKQSETEKPTTPAAAEKPAEKAGGEKGVADAASEAVDLGKDEAVLAVLVKADAYDGKEDKVVSKCPNCALGMDGSDQHALTAAGYSMHFCSADCKAAYEKDTRAMIVAMKVPQSE